MASITLTAIEGLPVIRQGDNLGELIARALEKMALPPVDGDVAVVCQKVVSKAEGRIRRLDSVEPGALAKDFAARWDKDPRMVQLVLDESRRVVRMERGLLIVETGPGWVCANAGIDESNLLADGYAALLPLDPDRSAAEIRAEIHRLTGALVGVVITDTFGRPWRVGLTEVCLGIAGLEPLCDMRGYKDLGGRELHHTVIAIADELAGAAGLLMGKADGIPAVLVRGYRYQAREPGEVSAKALIRDANSDLFR
jgi:coenzyme F420-0:L-glutamate ligase/coenzyme F420-1:gamma-L-glutamate ligase